MSTATLEWTDEDSRRLTVTLVARDGHHMPLQGEERHEAIRAMLARDVPVEQIAERLRINVKTVRRDAADAGIKLPGKPPIDWWITYLEPSRTPEHRRRQRAERRARRAAA